MDASPIFVSGSVTIDPGSQGSPNNEAFINPTDGPIEVHEIRFQIGMSPAVYSSGVLTALNFLTGGLIGCELSLGKLPVTNNAVPIWSFGKYSNSGQEYVGLTAGTAKKFLNYAWKLKRPLYLPAGKGFTASFTNFGSGGVTNPIDVRMSYSAKPVAPKNKNAEIHIPWAAAYRSKIIELASAGTDSSKETDLRPPVKRSYVVERFGGRCPLNPFVEDFSVLSAAIYRVRMFDSRGLALIRDLTKFDLAFSRSTRSWELGELKMPASSYFTVYVSKSSSTDNTSGVYGPSNGTQVHVSAVGWYPAKVSEL